MYLVLDGQVEFKFKNEHGCSWIKLQTCDTRALEEKDQWVQYKYQEGPRPTVGWEGPGLCTAGSTGPFYSHWIEKNVPFPWRAPLPWAFITFTTLYWDDPLLQERCKARGKCGQQWPACSRRDHMQAGPLLSGMASSTGQGLSFFKGEQSGNNGISML